MGVLLPHTNIATRPLSTLKTHTTAPTCALPSPFRHTLQSHMDMVPARADSSNHDFNADPITLILDGDWIHADGTTLGADDGVGMAAALAVLEEMGQELPPIEALFTADEENTLSGGPASHFGAPVVA